MKKKLCWIILVIALSAGLISCGSPPDQGIIEPTKIQEVSNNEPYPSPGEESPDEGVPTSDDLDSSVSVENPYPEPLAPNLVDPGDGFMPADHEYAPQPGDDQFTRGKVFIENSQLRLLESYPVQVKLLLAGNLPTPCHNLRAIVLPPDAENRVQIEAYSVVDPDLICTQVLAPFEANIPLGSYTEGAFTIWINGEQSAEFKLP